MDVTETSAAIDRDLSAVLLELAYQAGSATFEQARYLDTLLQRACALMDAAGGGVLLADERGRLAVTAATGDPMAVLLQHSEIDTQGPGGQAYREGRRVLDPAVAASPAWPRLARAAAELGAGAVCAVPLQYGDQSLGAMTLLRRAAGRPALESLRAVQVLAEMATVGLLQQHAVQYARREADQLQTALDTRVVIEQAKGILAEQGDLEVEDAFAALRAYSRNHNLKLDTVARAVASGGLSCRDLLGSRAHPRPRPAGAGRATGPAEDTAAVGTAHHLRATIRFQTRQLRRTAEDTRLNSGQLRRRAAGLRGRARALPLPNAALSPTEPDVA